MADITNPEAIRWSDDTLRPLMEKFRALKAEVDAALTPWNGGLNTVIGSSAVDQLIDNREADSDLFGSDITNSVTQMQLFQTAMNLPGVVDVIGKPCVRSFRVQG